MWNQPEEVFNVRDSYLLVTVRANGDVTRISLLVDQVTFLATGIADICGLTVVNSYAYVTTVEKHAFYKVSTVTGGWSVFMGGTTGNTIGPRLSMSLGFTNRV